MLNVQVVQGMQLLASNFVSHLTSPKCDVEGDKAEEIDGCGVEDGGAGKEKLMS